MSDAWGDPDPKRAWRPGVTAVADPVDPDDAPPPPDGEWSYFPPAGGYAPEWNAPPPAPFVERARPHVVTGCVTAAVLVLLGAPLALLWRAVAPSARVVQTASRPQPVAPESNEIFAVDGWFVVVSVVVGLVVGAVAWLLLRERGPAGPVGLAVGGLLAALVAAEVGKQTVVNRYLYDFCNRGDVRCFVYDGTLHLHATAAVVVLPAAMLLAFTGLGLAFDRDRS